MTLKVITYKTKPESAEENARLVEAVYAELARDKTEGIKYATFRLDDGVSFVHVAVLEGETNPLSTSAAFGEFQANLGSRLVEGPVPSDATVVGNHGLLPE
jgi:hypothetical protein